MVDGFANNTRISEGGATMRRIGQVPLALLAIMTIVTTAEPSRGQKPPTSKVERTVLESMQSLRGEAARLRVQGKQQDAIPLLQKVLAQSEKALGTEHLEVARAHADLLATYSEVGDYKKAETSALRALGIRKKLLGDEHLDVAESLYSLGVVYVRRHDEVRAEPLLRQARSIYEKARKGIPFAQINGHLAEMLMAKGELQEAELLLLRNIKIYNKAYGSVNQDSAATMEVLATLYEMRGDYARVETYLGEAAVIWGSVLGEHNIKRGNALLRLGRMGLRKGVYEQAAGNLEGALSIFEKVRGSEDILIGGILTELAWAHKRRGDTPRATLSIRRALAIKEKLFGANDIRMAAALNDFGDICFPLWEVEAAYQRALAIIENAQGPEDPSLLRPLDGLAHYYARVRKYSQAQHLWERAFVIRQKAYGPDHPEIAASLLNLAEAHEAAQDANRVDALLKQAITIMERELAAQEKALGPDHPKVGSIWSALASIYSETGYVEKAIYAARRAAENRDYQASYALQHGTQNDKLRFMDVLSEDTDLDIWLHLEKAPRDPAA